MILNSQNKNEKHCVEIKTIKRKESEMSLSIYCSSKAILHFISNSIEEDKRGKVHQKGKI